MPPFRQPCEHFLVQRQLLLFVYILTTTMSSLSGLHLRDKAKAGVGGLKGGGSGGSSSGGGLREKAVS